jgi:hypothetical protein
MTRILKVLSIIGLTIYLASCASIAPQDSDPISSFNPSAQELQLYQKNGIKTVGDWKSAVLEMKNNGYINKNDTSHLILFDYLQDRELAKKTPGTTALDIRTQRVNAVQEANNQKKIKNQKILDTLFVSKWSLGNIPCDFNGGLYKQYSENFKMGIRLFINGKITETGQKVEKKFTVNDDGSITLVYKIYAQGNNLMEKMTGSANSVVSVTTENLRVDGRKLFVESNDKKIDLDKLLKKQGISYKSKITKSVGTKCPS